MKFIKKCVLACFIFSTAVIAAVDQNPKSVGTTQGRNAVGRANEAPYHNPALLGVERPPKGGILVVPLSNFSVGYWSDKLSITPSDIPALLDDDKRPRRVSKIFMRSFGLKDVSSSEASKIMTEEFKGGVRLYQGQRLSLFNYAQNRFAFDISTRVESESRIPDGALYIVFSNEKHLRRGGIYDFSTLRDEAIWTTDFTFHVGLPVSIPALHEMFKLRYGAGGVGVKYVMGHSILLAKAERGDLAYNGDENVLEVDGELNVKTAGFGYHGHLDNEGFMENGLPINGHGIGVDLGGILYDDFGSLTINVKNLGVLFWVNDVRQTTYRIKKDDLDAYDIIRGIEEARKEDSDAGLKIFDRDAGEYLSDDRDSLKESNGFATMLPLDLNFGYVHTWDFSMQENQDLRLLAEYANASVNYEQQLTTGPGRSFIPRLSVGGEAGALRGYVPLRMGFVIGGPEHFASALGAGLDFKYFSLNASYKAIGSMYFYPSRGVEIAAGVNINWGMSGDRDKDGIPDKEDECPSDPEDKDGFEDEDGCPDYDNDGDGIPDSLDKCPNLAEDIDGFEDEDGCPDYDNDKDEVPDTLDKCPDEPEDRDNFEDEDGCPDWDNDGDGVPDSLDKCPNLPEDIDMFEDEDGCPDYDNDKDGVPDTTDNCINDPETFNGYKDEDGCPDTLVKPTEKETKALNTNLRNINFKTGSAELTSASYAALDYVITFLRQYEHLRYEVQGHTDSRGSDEYNLVLSAARAGSVRAYLLSKGIPESRVIAIGYGETMPIADNNTASGRARNRRVEFRIVETKEEYERLKQQEAMFRERVREAKIKGVDINY